MPNQHVLTYLNHMEYSLLHVPQIDLVHKFAVVSFTSLDKGTQPFVVCDG